MVYSYTAYGKVIIPVECSADTKGKHQHAGIHTEQNDRQMLKNQVRDNHKK